MRSLRKLLSTVLVVCIFICVSVPALAREESYPSVSFVNLGVGQSKSTVTSTYIVPSDTFVVESLSWSPMGNNVRVEFLPVGGGTIKGWTFSGGNISYFYLSMSSLTAGDYYVSVKNMGPSVSAVTGTLCYSWQ